MRADGRFSCLELFINEMERDICFLGRKNKCFYFKGDCRHFRGLLKGIFSLCIGAQCSHCCGFLLQSSCLSCGCKAFVQVTQLLGWKQRQQLIFHLRQRLHGETRPTAPKVLLSWSSGFGASKRPWQAGKVGFPKMRFCFF